MEGTMLTPHQRQRIQLTAFAAAAIAFAIALTNPHFRAGMAEEMVLLSEAQTLQAEAKLLAFKRIVSVVNSAATSIDHGNQRPQGLPD
jgi:hypothetical protein